MKEGANFEQKPMKLKEAQETANMMNAVLRKEGKDILGRTEEERRNRARRDRLVGGSGNVREAIKPEDYDEALALVEEIKKAAQEQSLAKKIVGEIARFMELLAKMGLDFSNLDMFNENWPVNMGEKLRKLKEAGEATRKTQERYINDKKKNPDQEIDYS